MWLLHAIFTLTNLSDTTNIGALFILRLRQHTFSLVTLFMVVSELRYCRGARN